MNELRLSNSSNESVLKVSEFLAGCEAKYLQDKITSQLLDYVRLSLVKNRLPPAGVVAGLINWALQEIDDLTGLDADVELSTINFYWATQNESLKDFDMVASRDRLRENSQPNDDSIKTDHPAKRFTEPYRDTLDDGILNTILQKRFSSIDKVADFVSGIIGVAGPAWLSSIFQSNFSNQALTELYQSESGFEKFDPERYWETMYRKDVCANSPAYYWTCNKDGDRKTKASGNGPLYRHDRGYARFKKLLHAHVHIPAAFLVLYNSPMQAPKWGAVVQQLRSKFLDLIQTRVLASVYLSALEEPLFASVVAKEEQISETSTGDRRSFKREAKIMQLASEQFISSALKRVLGRIALNMIHFDNKLQRHALLFFHYLCRFTEERAHTFLKTVLLEFSRHFTTHINSVQSQSHQLQALYTMLSSLPPHFNLTSYYLAQIIFTLPCKTIYFPYSSRKSVEKSPELGRISVDILFDCYLSKRTNRHSHAVDLPVSPKLIYLLLLLTLTRATQSLDSFPKQWPLDARAVIDSILDAMLPYGEDHLEDPIVNSLSLYLKALF